MKVAVGDDRHKNDAVWDVMRLFYEVPTKLNTAACSLISLAPPPCLIYYKYHPTPQLWKTIHVGLLVIIISRTSGIYFYDQAPTWAC